MRDCADSRPSAMGQIESNLWGITLEDIGKIITRYGLVVILLWIGALKFTANHFDTTPEPLDEDIVQLQGCRDFPALHVARIPIDDCHQISVKTLRQMAFRGTTVADAHQASPRGGATARTGSITLKVAP